MIIEIELAIIILLLFYFERNLCRLLGTQVDPVSLMQGQSRRINISETLTRILNEVKALRKEGENKK